MNGEAEDEPGLRRALADDTVLRTRHGTFRFVDLGSDEWAIYAGADRIGTQWQRGARYGIEIDYEGLYAARKGLYYDQIIDAFA